MKVFGMSVFRLPGSGTHNLVFSPADVSGIEAIGRIPVFTTGIRIHHRKPEYPPKVVFWCGGLRSDAEKIVNLLVAQGFNQHIS